MRAIIGANYGDEGKGRVVSAFARHKTLVVRFNGGPQAAHTVVTPDGRRHVFHHVGSGAFAGAPTLFSRHALINPLNLRIEISELMSKGVWPIITVDPRCWVITPFDVAINQALELSRGNGRHGSCGQGINETVTRSHRGPELLADELTSSMHIIGKLKKIEEEWVPARCGELGINVPKLPSKALSKWVEDATWFARNIPTVDDVEKLKEAEDIIFEGAQGLGLDEVNGEFPYVTRSRTGLTHVIQLLDDAQLPISDLEVIYVTRWYLTRHGAGPLPGVCDWPSLDTTNVENPWQGRLRYAPLDYDALKKRIYGEHERYMKGRPLSVALTCLDHAYECGKDPIVVAENFHEAVNPNRWYPSFSPSGQI